ncbi:MAG: hypothetical protein HUU55_12870, partial [Myxococcales bacterium]|nr:hypothetical protein [Myxococcales bacterium]
IYAGDVLKSVNGFVIDRPDKMMALWVALEQASEVVVEIFRNGQPLVVNFPIVEDAKGEEQTPKAWLPDTEPVAP